MRKYLTVVFGCLFLVTLFFVVPAVSMAAISSPSAADADQLPIVPNIDAPMKARLRALLTEGAVRGNRPQVFAKVGNSITYAEDFLTPLGCGSGVIQYHRELQPLIDYTRAVTIPVSYARTECGRADSFNRDSVAAHGWWTPDKALEPATIYQCQQAKLDWMQCEIYLMRPSMTIIMFATKDLALDTWDVYRRDLSTVISQNLAEGVIPILSTIPPVARGSVYEAQAVEYVAECNRIIIELAQELNIPVMNYWLAMQAPDLVDYGFSADHVHPNSAPTGSTDFSPEGLRYGYNIRNLVALQTLAEIQRVVMNDGPTNTPTATPTITLTPTSTATASATSTATPRAFLDVASSDYFYQPVEFLVQRGAISGYDDNTFRPFNFATRAQVTKIVVVAEGWPLVAPANAHFSDVPVGSPFFPYVETAVEHRIISGYADHSFRPGENIIRGQLAKIVVSAVGCDLVAPPTATFVDVHPEDTFYSYIETAAAHDIISGYDDAGGRSFLWGAYATRGQIAKIVYKAVTAPDNKN